MIIFHHLGQSSQDSRNLSRCQIAKGKSPLESLGALDMNSNNESCMIRHLLVVWQHNTTNSDNSLHSESMDIVKKNTTHNQRPARSTGLGKNKGFPANQKGSGKNKG